VSLPLRFMEVGMLYLFNVFLLFCCVVSSSLKKKDEFESISPIPRHRRVAA